MRKKSDEKRRQIVRVAAEAFQELGYERTSMLTIAERLQGSKQTLYNYYPSKEDLLRAVLTQGIAQTSESALAEFVAGARKDMRKALIRGGVAYLTDQLSPATIALIRTVANLPTESHLAAEFYEHAIRSVWQRLAECLGHFMDEGRLRQSDPWLAALQFRALNQLDLYERRLLGADSGPDPKEIKRTATSAADAFLRIYGPDEAP